MEVTPRQIRETAREYAFRTLRENIVMLRLAPGSMVSEKELADEMGISRTPTREALIELSKSYIVDIIPQRGSFISKIDYNLVDEARFMRLVLENGVVEIICEQGTEKNFRDLEANIKLQEFYLKTDAMGKFFKMDNAFHMKLFVFANKIQVYHLMDSMMIHFDRVRLMRLHSKKEISTIFEDHIKILNALKNRDKEEAVRCMTEHLSRYKVDESMIREEYPDYFIKEN